MKYFSHTVLFSCLVLLSSCGGENENFDAEGNFEATEVIVSSEASGKILKFDIQEGQVLKTGQITATVDSLQLFLQRNQLIANIGNAQSRRPDIKVQIAAAEEQLSAAKIEQARVERLFKDGIDTQKQLDDINAQVELYQKQLIAQKISLESENRGISDEILALNNQVKQLDDQLQKCNVVSPINGTVLVKYAQAGELASTGKALFKIADLDNMFLRAYITGSQLTKIKIGQSLKVFTDFGTGANREYAGTVAWISGKSEFTPKSVLTRDERENLVYAVKIAVKNDGYLKIGMYGRIKFKE
ncbi:MAG: efflux RND transporter periplasmic adaptor subunit [Brevinematales bacterium]|jgi:HlyD family secretion protein